MSTEKIGAIIFGVITSVTAIAGLFITLSSPSADLNAKIDKQVSYTPPQYDKLMRESRKLASPTILSDLINKSLPEVSNEHKNELFERIKTNILMPWTPPFTNGVEQYQTMIFISISNKGSAIAKDVYVDLPQHALLMIEDDKKEVSNLGEQTRRYKIPSIRQGGTFRIWAWFPTELEKIDEYAISIGSDQQTADIEYPKAFTGLASRVADYYLIFIYLSILMILSFFYWIYGLFKPTATNP